MSNEWGDPEPFGEGEDGEPLFWECPNPKCSTQKTTATKAAAHCVGENSNSPKTTKESVGEPGSGDTKGGFETDSSASREAFADADFTAPEGRVWPPALLDREQWMGHVEKKPFAPWADRDLPEADPDEDARWKWGLTENYVDGGTIAIAEDDHRLDGRAFLQREHDPFAYVDGDDVRNPGTGEVHPAFVAVLDRLGLTYADVSQSGGGAHAIYQGELPEGVKEAAWQLDDEPWGDHDEGDLPSVEIYDGKRVCVMTGERVPGTPTEAREWDGDALHDLLDENDQLPEPVSQPTAAREEFDAAEYDPGATGSGETTDDVRDVFAAIERLDPKRVAEKTIVHRWNDDASTSDDTRAFHPTWGPNSNGTANVVNDKVWYDSGDEGGYGGPVVMALIDAGEMSHRKASPRRATGATWYDGVDHLRELGFAVPVHVPEAGDENSAGEEYDETPLWALRKAAVALDVCDREGFKQHETEDGETYLGFDRETFNATLDALDEAGIDHGREHIDGGVSGDRSSRPVANLPQPRACSPPPNATAPDMSADEGEQVLRDNWDAIQNRRVPAWLDSNQPTLFHDALGTGKTHNVAVALDALDVPHALLFQNHAKAREHERDDDLPSVDLHLKGAGQPVADTCMDAWVADANADEGEHVECPDHGALGECPRMHPIYDLDRDHPDRRLFKYVEQAVGVREASSRLYDRVKEHAREEFGEGDSFDTLWHNQFDKIEGADCIVGVHEYAELETLKKNGRAIVTDEAFDPTATSTTTDRTLLRLAGELVGVAETQPDTDENHIGGTLRALADIASALAEASANGRAIGRAVDLPEFDWYTERVYNDASEHRKTDLRAETFARAKIAYNETVLNRLKRDEDPTTDANQDRETTERAPLAVDDLLAAIGAVAGPETPVGTAALRAAAVPTTLDECPHCGGGVTEADGARFCVGHDGDGCGWGEENGLLTVAPGRNPEGRNYGDVTDPLDECVRADAVLDRQVPTEDGPLDEPVGTLRVRRLPAPDDLPDAPLLLDATADPDAAPERIGAVFGVDADMVRVEDGGTQAVADAGTHVTQITDAQYHPGTIQQSDRAQARFQDVLDTVGDVFDRPLTVGKQDVLDGFDLPDEGASRKYGALRGLNMTECDAVVAVGPQHPREDDLQQRARLYSLFRDDVHAGGTEYSTRRGPDGEPAALDAPARKLRYADENGDGLAVPTKHYDGMMGVLFRELRAGEIEQAAHRPRPALAAARGEQIPVVVLTNVPTDLAVDEVCSLDDLASPLRALLPVPEGALRLLGYGRDVLEGDAPDGFRDDAPIEARPGRTLVEVRDDGTIANKAKGWHRLAQANGEDVSLRTIYDWFDALEAVGLLTPEEYEQHAGVSYAADSSTLKSALQVLSSNGGFKVAAVRRFAEKVRGADEGLDWLAWAESVFDLGGDRCEWDPPPAPGG